MSGIKKVKYFGPDSDIIGVALVDPATGAAATGEEVAIADAADVTQGAVADAAATAGGTGTLSAKLRTISASIGAVADAAWTSGSGSVIAVLKAIRGALPAALGQTTSAASVPVVLASDNAGLSTVTGTIADATAITPEIDLGVGKSLVGIITPAGWGTNVLTFQASPTTGGTYTDLYTLAGTEIASGSLVASHWHPVDPADFAGVRFLKIRSGTGAVPANQSGGDILTCVVRAI